MDTYEYAMQLEKDGESYYRDAAARSDNKGIRKILIMLADAEVRHYELFKRMKAKETVHVEESILQDVKNVFLEMKDEGDLPGEETSQIELYRKAQDVEKKTETLYLRMAGETQDGAEREALLKVAKEETKHFLTLEEIIHFVSRPEQWLENAEWYHLEEY